MINIDIWHKNNPEEITGIDWSFSVLDCVYCGNLYRDNKWRLYSRHDAGSTRSISAVIGSNRQDLKLERAVNNMKEIILTDQEARQVDTFLEFTSSRITEELKLWESLKVYTENAEKNVEFWKSTAQAVNRLRVQLL